MGEAAATATRREEEDGRKDGVVEKLREGNKEKAKQKLPAGMEEWDCLHQSSRPVGMETTHFRQKTD